MGEPRRAQPENCTYTLASFAKKLGRAGEREARDSFLVHLLAESSIILIYILRSRVGCSGLAADQDAQLCSAQKSPPRACSARTAGAVNVHFRKVQATECVPRHSETKPYAEWKFKAADCRCKSTRRCPPLFFGGGKTG